MVVVLVLVYLCFMFCSAYDGLVLCGFVGFVLWVVMLVVEFWF